MGVVDESFSCVLLMISWWRVRLMCGLLFQMMISLKTGVCRRKARVVASPSSRCQCTRTAVRSYCCSALISRSLACSNSKRLNPRLVRSESVVMDKEEWYCQKSDIGAKLRIRKAWRSCMMVSTKSRNLTMSHVKSGNGSNSCENGVEEICEKWNDFSSRQLVFCNLLPDCCIVDDMKSCGINFH